MSDSLYFMVLKLHLNKTVLKKKQIIVYKQ